MTPETLISEYLSLRVWLQRIVLPTMVCLLGFLYMYAGVYETQGYRDHTATIVGFFAFYFVLVRGGHMIMIRSLHFDLMKKYEIEYRNELAVTSPILFRRRTVGFTLAKIKRHIHDDAKRGKDSRLKH